MAVDSNVIIFERIRDELMEGKSVAGAVEAGFQKAFNAIFDANITHGIVAVILLSYGSGPVRGFAGDASDWDFHDALLCGHRL